MLHRDTRAARGRRVVGFATLALFGLLAAGAAPARAQVTVVTEDIANSDSPEFVFPATPTINDGGVVAFRSERDAAVGGGQGVYTATSLAGFTTIARTDTSPEFDTVFNPNINAAGVVSFSAFRDGGTTDVGLYTATGTAGFTLVARNETSPEFNSLGNPDINDSGLVAFVSGRDAAAGGGSGLYTATGAAAFTTIARSDTSPEFSAFNGENFNINGNGVIAFRATRDPGVGGGQGIYTTAGPGAFTTVALTSDAEFSGFTGVGINDSGLVAFSATRDGGGAGLYTATAQGSFTTLVRGDLSPEINAFSAVSVNNAGAVAFRASRDAGAGGGVGLYIVLPGETDPTLIVGTGDALFGSAVSSVTVGARDFLSNGNQVTFGYTLANGVSGVARSTVSVTATAAPEPAASSLAVVAGAVGLLAASPRRRKRSPGRRPC